MEAEYLGAMNIILLGTFCHHLLSSYYRYNKYSFVCGNGTVFDQEALVCNYPENALPCEDSNQLYGLVEFGRIEDY